MRRKKLIRSGLVTTDELANYFGVTRVTTYNWRKKGCPFERKAVVDSFGGETYRIYFDLEKVKKWKKQYEDSITHGPQTKK